MSHRKFETCETTELLREALRTHPNLRALARVSGVSLGALYNLKNKDHSHCSLAFATAIVPHIFDGNTLKIDR